MHWAYAPAPYRSGPSVGALVLVIFCCAAVVGILGYGCYRVTNPTVVEQIEAEQRERLQKERRHECLVDAVAITRPNTLARREAMARCDE